MPYNEAESALRGVDQKTRKILGKAVLIDDGWDIKVLLPEKTFILPDEVVNKWVTRPAVITDRLPGPTNPGPIIEDSGMLYISRGFYIVHGKSVLARYVELRLKHEEDDSGLSWVYQLVLWRSSREMGSKTPLHTLHAETSHFKNNLSDTYRSPVWGRVLGEVPELDQLNAFNKYLRHTLRVEPVRTSGNKYTLNLNG